jgi:hypothetical protein
MLYKITIGQFNEQLLEDQNSEEGTLMGHVLKR